jgi:RNA 2',3'-cyclic 3'-phosphodiesterase
MKYGSRMVYMTKVGQLYLPGMEPVPVVARARRFESHNFYFAFRPDTAASDAVMRVSSGLRRRYGANGSFIARDNLHISLLSIWQGDVIADDLVEIASAHVQAIAGQLFTFRFDAITCFPRRRGYCTVLTATHHAFELYNLRRKFVERFAGKGGGDSFKPHITLLYGDNLIAQRLVEPICWTARDFVLIHSFVGQGRQEIVGRWPLR